MQEEVEPHAYRLGSPLASVIGIAERMLERSNLPADVRLEVRAIRDIALEALEMQERAPQRDPGRR